VVPVVVAMMVPDPIQVEELQRQARFPQLQAGPQKVQGLTDYNSGILG
jgi:hypothetical protein